MKIGIIGNPFVGKTTIFNLLTGSTDQISKPGETKIVNVKDPRITTLSEMYHPKKTIYATLEFTDTFGLDPEAGAKERNRVFGLILKCDAILWTLGNFAQCATSALDQFESIKTEIMLRDLELVENRKTNLENSKKKLEKSEVQELEVIRKLHVTLEEENWPQATDYSEEELKAISSMALFTLKPSIIVLNSDEESYKKNNDDVQSLKNICKEFNFALTEICGKFEMELNELDEEEKDIFMEEMNISESGLDILTRIVYEYVGLISFFTVGTDEVRAWTIKENTNAKSAAGKIHSDLERGFIRAELMSYDDLIEHGSEKALKDKGLFKVVGKDHIVLDGDILNIRFNV
jgi:GTP-binding protein YchF